MPGRKDFQRCVQVSRPLKEPPIRLFEPPAELLMTEDQLETLETIIVPPPEPVPPHLLQVQLTQDLLNTRYRNFTLDLGTARSGVPLGLANLGIVADTMTIIKATGNFTYTLNDPTNSDTPAEKGQVEDQFQITEIYITNEAQTDKQAIIRVNYNPNLIRQQG